MLTITARTRCIGFHHWPDAPERRAYLRDPHRHEFHVAATVLVDHGDRDVEFHDLAGEMAQGMWTLADGQWGPDAYQFGARSVEVLAQQVAEWLKREHGYTVVTVTVSEDGQHDGTWWGDHLAVLFGAGRR